MGASDCIYGNKTFTGIVREGRQNQSLLASIVVFVVFVVFGVVVAVLVGGGCGGDVVVGGGGVVVVVVYSPCHNHTFLSDSARFLSIDRWFAIQNSPH